MVPADPRDCPEAYAACYNPDWPQQPMMPCANAIMRDSVVQGDRNADGDVCHDANP
jgi:hypothetical protein